MKNEISPMAHAALAECQTVEDALMVLASNERDAGRRANHEAIREVYYYIASDVSSVWQGVYRTFDAASRMLNNIGSRLGVNPRPPKREEPPKPSSRQ